MAKTYALNEAAPDVRERLIREWDSEKNGVPLDRVTKYSHKNFFWKCEQGHEWTGRMLTRLQPGNECPFCQGRRISQPIAEKTVLEQLASLDKKIDRLIAEREAANTKEKS